MKRITMGIVCLMVSFSEAALVAKWDFSIPAGGSYGDTITNAVDIVNSLEASASTNVNESTIDAFYAGPSPDLSGASVDVRGGGFLNVPNNQILTGYTNAVSGFAAFSIDAHIRLRGYANPSVIVRKTGSNFSDDNDPGYQFYVGLDGSLNFRLNDWLYSNTGATASSDAGAIELLTWYHVTGTWDGTVIRVYIDGVESGSIPWTADQRTSGVFDFDTEGSLGIGGWLAENGSYAQQMNGNIDDVSIYDEAIVPLIPTIDEIDDVSVEVVGGTNVVLSWMGDSVGTYTVQYKTNLVSGAWSNLVENISGVDALMSVTNSVSGAHVFYRTTAE